MKKILAILLLSLAFVAGLAAYSPRMTVTGLVHIYGSAPHTYVGLVTDEGKEYSLQVAEKSSVTLKQLSDLQGVHLELAGVMRKYKHTEIKGFMELKDGLFIVSTATEIK
jgi:hypothetical protein